MSFIEHFNPLEDGRTGINICHELLDVVFLVVTAILSGAEGGRTSSILGKRS